LLLKPLLFCLLTILITPQLAIAKPALDVVNSEQGDYTYPLQTPKHTLSDAILANCWLYTKTRYPSLPSTILIQSNIQQEVAEVAVMQYGNLEHYAVVESHTSTTITISETNFGGDFKNIRTISREDIHLRGFYKL
jgi:hypothetical protein